MNFILLADDLEREVSSWVRSMNSGQQVLLIVSGILFFVMARIVYKNYWNIIDFFRNPGKK